MKKFVAIILVVFLFGCSAALLHTGNRPDYYVDRAGTRVEITDPAGQCVLYKVLGANTDYYRTGLFVANYGALKAEFYTPEEAMKALDQLQEAVNNPAATVGSVINSLIQVAAQASKVGAPEIILVTEGLDIYAGDMTPIDDCTWYKLTAYIGKQKNLVFAFQASG